MKKALLVITASLAMICAPSFASAQERLGDGAMGAVAGLLVGGPVGAVAGGVIGYTAGPGIAQSWGLRKQKRSHHARNHGQPPK
jgi:hypothetical protein